MPKTIEKKSWVSFCMSTYKRPVLLQQQLALLLGQENKFFDIVISDNDPEGSGRAVAENFNDPRIKYFQNAENIGMVKSFNKSIERAVTDYVILVTDDDPVDIDFLSHFYPNILQYPGYSLYGGFARVGKKPGNLELINGKDFLIEMLDPSRTISILWSSCILNRKDTMEVGMIPDYDSPHLADHALLSITGSRNGAVIVNRMYSHVTFHENNFSKLNFDYYVKGCKGFYNTLSVIAKNGSMSPGSAGVIVTHLDKWFISNFFNLKKYYTIRKDQAMLQQINACAEEVIAFPFMKRSRIKYRFKDFVLKVKTMLGMIK